MLDVVASNDVVLWDSESLVSGADEYRSEYITDVFRRGAGPPPAAVAIAIGAPIGVPPEDIEEQDGPWIVGAAVVYGKGGVAQGKMRVRFEPVLQVRPIRLSDALARAGLTDVEWPRPLTVTSLSRAEGAKLLAALGEWDPGLGPWLGAARRPCTGHRDANASSRSETRDAVGLAGLIAGVEVPGSQLRPVPSNA
jgi:hypothetical protein